MSTSKGKSDNQKDADQVKTRRGYPAVSSWPQPQSQPAAQRRPWGSRQS